VTSRRGVLGVTHLASPANSDTSFPAVRTTNRAGRTEHFEVFYDRGLGESGRAAGGIVLNRAENDLSRIREWFDLRPDDEEFVVVLARLPEHARTYRLTMPDDKRSIVFCDVDTTPRLEALQSCFFVALQLADSYAVASGWDAVIGGALARVLATSLYPRRIAGFTTSWVWMEGGRNVGNAGHEPWAATGQAVLFLNYLHHQLGFRWREIATSTAPTLDAIAERLTGSSEDHLAAFRALLAMHYPVGQPSAFFPDNPFPLPDEQTSEKSESTLDDAPGGRGSRARPSERRVCLLTGASGTLGSEMRARLADHFDFAAVYNSRPVEDVFAIRANLTEEGECERIVEATLERFGRIDLVVNAAVLSRWGDMLESAHLVSSAADQFLLNAVVPLQIACAAARQCWQEVADENRSSNRNVVNVSSISGQNLFAGEGQSVYAASKAALDHLTGHMALEFAAIGVRVNAVAPNSFPRNIPTSRIIDAIEKLDDGKDTGTIVVVDGEADQQIRLFA
jgi:NAD(P)-dependent dehydrogenase (short-subunit alcohol dehydrogenase family)